MMLDIIDVRFPIWRANPRYSPRLPGNHLRHRKGSQYLEMKKQTKTYDALWATCIEDTAKERRGERGIQSPINGEEDEPTARRSF